MLARPMSALLRSWFTDPIAIPVYLVLAALSLLVALGTGADELGWTMFGTYLALSVVAVGVQRPSAG